MGYEQENTIWECSEQCNSYYHENCKLGLKLRLVCKKTRDIKLLGPVTKEISSTEMYKIVIRSIGKERQKQLQNQVLSTNLFCQFLKEDHFDKMYAAKRLRR